MNERQNSASDRQYEESNIWLNWSNTKEYMQSLINRSAIFARIRYKCSSSYRLKRQLLDSTLGLLTWYLLVVADLFPPDVFSVLSFTLISIKELIIWLSLYPAGLKLNSPLNNALSNFFLYHIYLWQIYLSVLSAWLGPTIVALSCVLGLSIFLATISDLISLLTIHMFCFHKMITNEEAASLLSSNANTDYGGTSRLTELGPITPVTVAWHNVIVTTKKGGRLVLDSISGLAQSGHLTALMGASGAGKTTLLNTLLVRNLHGLIVEGRVTVNGRELRKEITSVSGYVQQDELFVSTLTVKEHLSLQARLRLPGEYTKEKRKRRIYQVMTQLGLLGCQNTLIGAPGIKKGISGGEAKRLAFASELLNNPAILFCDEPTTGLDSFMAESVVRMLSKLAHSGRTIICTIHQPASELFNIFDRVLFLAGGRTAYIGPPAKALSFLDSCGYRCPDDYNPADMIIETLAVIPHEEEYCRQRISQICSAFLDSDIYDEISEELKASENIGDYPIARKQAPLSMQLSALLHRSFLDNLRNPSLARAKIIQKLIMGLFLGLLYLQTLHDNPTRIGITNVNGALFFLVCEFTYATLFGILNFLPVDFPLVAREYHDGMYGIAPYYFTRALSYVPLFTVDGAIMLLVSYWMIGLQSTIGHIVFAVLIGIVIEQSAAAFGVMLSSVCPSFPVAVSIAGPMLTLLSLTGGLYANVGELPKYISWLQYLSWFRFGFEALAINQWSDVASGECYMDNCKMADAILAQYSFAKENFTFDILLMLVYIIFYYTLGYVGLYFRVKRAR
uniref:ABC transporter domain-containing protein n=1 Tax=Ascaris lumbricoides TaxID=6252 RepID=A0A0M3I3N3_ASCLU